ncbi:hypothetical protein HF086_016713 [Spodoptera exigua]|uniref:Post-GPI attachment to proteins factor 3 n=1 Tax=Spodoptera exigua TaxID=7107 RepID=A0A922MVA5_SPOEX|nr:hypothetical protein HF086_016713 [Spodoptera exigua]
MNVFIIIAIALFLCERSSFVSCSIGDRSMVYRNCLNRFERENCTENGVLFKSNSQYKQDYWSKVLQWSCSDECRYQCMWITVDVFHNNGDDTPKFHGKWPFIRMFGMQEPAAAFASMLNLAANVYMFKQLKQLRITQANLFPFVIFWKMFSLVCMNAWVWSTIFHMRDTDFTEFMDYACALSMVMGLLVAAIVSFSLCYLGAFGSVIWLVLSWHQWTLRRRYAWRMLAFTLLSGAALSLELFDFPPRHGVWDAHALWHLSTAPLPLLFYSYVIADLRYVASKELDKFAFKLT